MSNSLRLKIKEIPGYEFEIYLPENNPGEIDQFVKLWDLMPKWERYRMLCLLHFFLWQEKRWDKLPPENYASGISKSRHYWMAFQGAIFYLLDYPNRRQDD